jgi:hypothetical protein
LIIILIFVTQTVFKFYHLQTKNSIMKKLFFTLIFISGVAVATFGQNATAKKKGIATSAPATAADKQAAAQSQAEAANDLDPATLMGAANGAQPKATTNKFNKTKTASKAVPAVKAN